MSYDQVVVYQGGPLDGTTELQTGPVRLRTGYSTFMTSHPRHDETGEIRREVWVVIAQYQYPKRDERSWV